LDYRLGNAPEGFRIMSGAPLKPFTALELVRLERVSDPQVSPDGTRLAYALRETDLAANKGTGSLWLRPLQGPAATPRRLTAPGAEGSAPRWSPDSRSIYFLSKRGGSAQVWRLDLAGGDAQPVTRAPLDIGSFMLSPDGGRLLVSMDVYNDCDTLAGTRRRLDEAAAHKRSGRVYDRLFIRHWDSWADGTRSQLFVYALDGSGCATGEPAWITRGIDGDVPSKPFGDDAEYCFTADGRAVIFSARIAGRTEAWSTRFDLYRVPADGSAPPQNLTAANPAWDTGPRAAPDGHSLAYRAMRRAGFEADRFAIMLLDFGTGVARELLPQWDRSADALQWSPDGRTLYALAEDLGQRRLYAIDLAAPQPLALTGEGHVSAYSVAGGSIVYALDSIGGPAQLYRLPGAGDWQGAGRDRPRTGRAAQPEVLTAHNAALLDGIGFGAYEQFSFRGWNDDTVHGYIVRPVDFVPGRRYPVAFIVHGGPQSSMGNHFHYRWNPQTYAGAGFAVVCIDFHGSTGYGQAFCDAISGHWGDRPLEDLQKGWAHALAHYDFLDGTRACALGASYGGYMINWIAGHWSRPASGPWRCLVNHDGVFDTRMSYYGTEELWFDEWEHQGPQYQVPGNFERFNPVNRVADWHLPMLVIQGGLDFRVPVEQGIATFTALQRRGIASQFLHFPDENHWVLKPHNSLQWHETVEAWLRRWTAVAPAGPGAGGTP
jgi:dipeptidyl aminopeptidase/acylaminoacyl peptidase